MNEPRRKRYEREKRVRYSDPTADYYSKQKVPVGERALWLAVAERTRRDALGSGCDEYEQRQALAWFRARSMAKTDYGAGWGWIILHLGLGLREITKFEQPIKKDLDRISDCEIDS